MLDKAFDALASYDWGSDRSQLDAIDEAVVSTHDDMPARRELEQRLTAILPKDVSRAAKDYVCRKLTVVGTATCVSALAELLPDAELSHMARYALERIPEADAASALREAMSQLDGAQRIGVIASLGVRQDEESIDALAGLLGDADVEVAQAAAHALGAIRTDRAAQALAQAKPNQAAQLAATDASLACAEQLLGTGQRLKALAIYKGLAGADQPKHVRLAATRGMLACAGTSG